jgi:hypothetical protein
MRVRLIVTQGVTALPEDVTAGGLPSKVVKESKSKEIAEGARDDKAPEV